MSDNEQRLKHFSREIFKVVSEISEKTRGDSTEVCIDRRLWYKLNYAAGHLDWALRMSSDEEDGPKS